MLTVGTWSAMGELTANHAPKVILTSPTTIKAKSSTRILIGQFSSFALTSGVMRE
jgi:methionine synthase II (cobalamin-independent)